MTSPAAAPALAPPPTPPGGAAIPSLATAFLALGDGEGASDQRSLPRTLAAVASALVLGFSAPAAWAAAPKPVKPNVRPAAMLSSKSAAPAPDDEDAG